MTDPDTTATGLPDSGDLAGRLRAQAPALVDAVLAALTRDLDVYGSLPMEALSGDIAATVLRNILLFADAMTLDEMPSDDRIDEIRRSAARRAEERIPLELLLRAYPIAARVVYDLVVGGTAPDDLGELVPATSKLLGFLSEVLSAAASGYLEQHQMIIGATQTHEQRLVDALLSGSFDRQRGEFSQLDLPGRLEAWALAFAPHPDELESGVDAAIAARRKLGRARSELRRLGDGLELSSLTPRGGIALLPATTVVGSRGPSAGSVIDGLAAATGVEVTAAVAAAETDDVPSAVREAEEVLEIVRWLGLAPAAYRLDDVLVEYQVTRPGPGRRALAACVVPVADDPALLSTLRDFLRHGGNRRRVAIDQNVHPNTVDYRTAKILRLTGLDLGDPADAFKLRTSLLAHDAEHHATLPR